MVVVAASKSKINELENRFPIHWLVWHNNVGKLESSLADDCSTERLEKLDPCGRTPLMLAITLGHTECAKLLLSYNADANAENRGYWAASHEAVCTGDPDLLRTVLQYRDYQRAERTRLAVTRLLTKLEETADFYTEMRWEFSSWIPFVSKMCPSDTYRIFKRGNKVRIDTTLIGFDSATNWQRGNQSFVFSLEETGPRLALIDHEKQRLFLHTLTPSVSSHQNVARHFTCDADLSEFEPTDEMIVSRLTSPVVTTYVDVDKIGFERSKGAGLLGWISSSDRSENVSGFDCKVFNACNVDLVTKTRTEHLTEAEKSAAAHQNNSNPMETLLKFVQRHESKESDIHSMVYGDVEAEEYFDEGSHLGRRDIGRPKQLARRSHSFKATLWLSDHFPLNLQEQVTPVVDLMAASNAHFSRLKQFMQLQLPAGFPVKIEMPLFHVLSARITFSNVDHSSPIDPALFDIPSQYQCLPTLTSSRSHLGIADANYQDDMYLQFAIQQSLSDSNAGENVGLDYELQRAISNSLHVSTELSQAGHADTHREQDNQAVAEDTIFARTLEISKKEEEERQRQLVAKEEEDIRRAIELSVAEQ